MQLQRPQTNQSKGLRTKEEIKYSENEVVLGNLQ